MGNNYMLGTYRNGAHSFLDVVGRVLFNLPYGTLLGRKHRLNITLRMVARTITPYQVSSNENNAMEMF